MARGWESKSVADQIEEGESQKERARTVPASLEDRAQKERLASLLLSKSRLLQQLERATHPRHRDVLLNGLKAIEKEIDAISSDTLTNVQAHLSDP
jgi:hypothetical protein